MKEPIITMGGGKYSCRATRPAITRSQTRVRAQETIWKGKSLEEGRKKLVALSFRKGSKGGERKLPGRAESKGVLHRQKIGEDAQLCCCGCYHDQ